MNAAMVAPAAPVAIARCASYDEDLPGKLTTLFDRLGGIGRLIRGKTVTVKVNLTGKTHERMPAHDPGVTHWTHPAVAGALCRVLDDAGARRIRLVESTSTLPQALEEFMIDGGWDVKAISRSAKRVEFENTANLGRGKRYSRLRVPYGGFIFPAYDVNHSYEDTDVFVTIAKMKNHGSCGVTLAMKNSFGIVPNSIYGNDAGEQEPNESARQYRSAVLHAGKRAPSRSAPQEIDLGSPRQDGYRLPRIVVDLVAARPIDLAIIDGIVSIAGGLGPLVKNAALVRPGVLIAGRNPVCTDAVATAVMGFDPAGRRDSTPFYRCDNLMQLAESRGIGSADLKRIEVRGISVRDARFDFGPWWKG